MSAGSTSRSSAGINVAFAGLTAAGKTTHAKLLADELGYDYISATDILLQILGIRDAPTDQVWFTRLDEITKARGDGAVDSELERRLIEMSRTRRRTVFDTWALAWIGADPLVRVWIESDVESRARKCLVSQRSDAQRNLAECRRLIEDKDAFNRRIFHERHGFDLFTDRHRYHAILCNTHLISEATRAAADVGIAAFAPVAREAVACVLNADDARAYTLRVANPREVQCITTPSGLV